MPYRKMDLSSPPQFTFIEKLFASGKKFNRVLGHVLIIMNDLVGFIKVLAIVITAGLMLVLATIGVCKLYILLIHYLINYKYINNDTAAVITIAFIVLLAVMPKIITQLKKMIETNSYRIQSSIKQKLNRHE